MNYSKICEYLTIENYTAIFFNMVPDPQKNGAHDVLQSVDSEFFAPNGGCNPLKTLPGFGPGAGPGASFRTEQKMLPLRIREVFRD
jgi:hypothetical protein